jgi:peptide/nickel transport system permease protein
MRLKYIAARIAATIPVVVVVAVCVFGLLYLTPGDPAAIIGGDRASPADLERIRVSMGLDRPFPVRFLEWTLGVFQGDLGTSIFTRFPVTRLIAEHAEPTAMLMLVTLTITICVAIPLGVIAAGKQGSLIDRAAMFICVLGFSVPVFVSGYVLAYWFGVRLRWLPVQGYFPLDEGLWRSISSLLLPAVALASPYIALTARITRSTMLEVLGQDYIRTARAKGLGDGPVWFIHALKNAANPILTVIGLGFASLVGGAVVTETVFAIPGIGRMTVDAVLQRDYPVIQGVVLVFSFIYVLINLGVDLLYGVFDPRTRQ